MCGARLEDFPGLGGRRNLQKIKGERRAMFHVEQFTAMFHVEHSCGFSAKLQVTDSRQLACLWVGVVQGRTPGSKRRCTGRGIPEAQKGVFACGDFTGTDGFLSG